MSSTVPKLYKQYFIDKHDERRDMFKLLVSTFSLRSGLYPGSFVHITPSFYIPEMAYIDNDKRINTFFNDPDLLPYINKQKQYDEDPKVTGMQADFNGVVQLQENYYEIMFSFYAGFISGSCKNYLRTGGLLVTNNSHGDASLAIADEEYDVLGVIVRNGDDFRLKTNQIDDYCTKKDGTAIDTEKVKTKMTGEKFSKYAFAYVFRKL